MKLNEKALGLASGIIAAASSLLHSFGGGMMKSDMMGGMYGGGVTGVLWHFAIAAVAGYAFAWVYNRFAKS